MAKRGTCAYCAEDDVVLTVEHPFPDSWYPDETPSNEMLTVPACSPCNAGFDRVEKRLFLPFVLMLPSEAPFDSIVERALRSAEASSGKSVRDIFHRASRARSLMSRVSIVGPAEEAAETIWTPLGRQHGDLVTAAGLHVHGAAVIRMEWEDIQAIAIKLLRGCYFARTGRPLEKNAQCWARNFDVDPRPILREWLQRATPQMNCGRFPFEYSLAVLQNGAAAAAFFVLWGTVVLFAAANLSQTDEPTAGAI